MKGKFLKTAALALALTFGLTLSSCAAQNDVQNYETPITDRQAEEIAVGTMGSGKVTDVKEVDGEYEVDVQTTGDKTVVVTVSPDGVVDSVERESGIPVMPD